MKSDPSHLRFDKKIQGLLYKRFSLPVYHDPSPPGLLVTLLCFLSRLEGLEFGFPHPPMSTIGIHASHYPNDNGH